MSAQTAVSLSLNAAATARFEPEVEVRLAVVMYGGVSLAIYINGVAQELLRMVRATAPRTSSQTVPTAPMLDSKQLKSSERVYRKLGQMMAGNPRRPEDIQDGDPIVRRFVVDILSGTSAGGINAVFLAKALANQLSMEQLKNLWVEEGDIEKLINDNKSIKGLPLSPQNPPQSLLESRRMYLKLLEAFEGMETGETKSRTEEVAESSFVDQLDLYITATDITGLKLPLKLSDKVVEERRYKNVFHFIYANAIASGNPRNDFEHWNNPMLAYASRCTSAFPFAFEPMSLADIKDLPPYRQNGRQFERDKENWRKFFNDYKGTNGNSVDIVSRAFGDGGYLDNKPFSYATDTLLRRRADIPVDRKLLYIEPSPEHPELEEDPEKKPDAVENVIAALLTLPHQEAIREDLERILERNRLIGRVDRILANTEIDVGMYFGNRRRPKYTDENDWANKTLKEMIKRHGPAYGGYYRLRISMLTEELADMFARVAGFDENSDEAEAIRYIIREWRELHYDETPEPDGPKKTQNRFLMEFDLAYRMRRLNFVLGEIDRLLAFNERTNATIKAAGIACKPFSKENPQEAMRIEQAKAELFAIKKVLNQALVDLRTAGRTFRSRDANSPLHPMIIQLQMTGEMLKDLLEQDNEDRRKLFAKKFVEHPDRDALLSKMATVLAEASKKVFDDVSAKCKEILNPSGASEIRRCLWHYYVCFDDYDLIRFPIMTGTEAEESDEVEIFRVSPWDATMLVDEKSTQCSKLAGVSFGHFGAFMDQLWRKSDMLWGRLDGAERIICALLPGNDSVTREIREDLTLQASAEILVEEIEILDSDEARKLIVEAFLHSSSNKTNNKALIDFIKKIRSKTTDTKLRILLNENHLLKCYNEEFAIKARPSRQEMLFSLARSTQVIGKILDGLREKYAISGKQVSSTLVLLGRALWGLVEVSIPRRLPQLLYRYWIRLIYLLLILLIIGGVALGFSTVQKFGFVCLGITVALDLGPRLLSAWISGAKIKRLLIALVSVAAVGLSALGIWKIVDLVGSLGSAWSKFIGPIFG